MNTLELTAPQLEALQVIVGQYSVRPVDNDTSLNKQQLEELYHQIRLTRDLVLQDTSLPVWPAEVELSDEQLEAVQVIVGYYSPHPSTNDTSLDREQLDELYYKIRLARDRVLREQGR